GISVLRGKERCAEPGAPAQPRAWTVARLLVELVHRLQDGEDAPCAQRVAHGEGTLRVAETEYHRAVEIFRRSNAHLCNIAADVDDVRDHALGDEARRVVDHRDRHAVCGEQGVRGVPDFSPGQRIHHQRAALGKAEQWIYGYRARRIEALL